MIYDLGQPLFPGMPHHPAHPPFLFSLNKLHGDYTVGNGVSSSSESFTTGGHVGTHIDALSHFSCCGKMFGGVTPTQSAATGIVENSVESIAPIFRPGVLFDIAKLMGVEALPVDFEVTPKHLEACSVLPEPGGIALIRTGWARYWNDSRQFLTGGTQSAHPVGPGPRLPAAQWLSGKGVFAAGSDTVAFELVPSLMEVHVHLLVDNGIHIIECLNLETLSASGNTSFQFVALPLKIRGGTGSPIRPVAVIGSGTEC